ncbi:MAG: conserved protein of unknown function [Nitrospira sp.]
MAGRAKTSKTSAGILLYRRRTSGVEVFLAHPGGPFWARKDDGAWSLPKGEYDSEEDPLMAARREFTEETGLTLQGPFRTLGPLKQPGGKTIMAYAVEGDADAASIVSNTFTLEWPPRSGKLRRFPEIDRAGWFELEAAREKLLPGQRPFLDRLKESVTEWARG